MSSIVKTFFLVFIFSSCCAVCKLEKKVEKQKYLFEIENINHAWGYSHNGFYIDDAGSIYKYKFNFNDEKYKNDDSSFYSKENLVKKYDHNKEPCGSVDLNVLKEKARLIPSVLHEGYSKKSYKGADQGQRSYIAYSWNENEKKYQKVVLKSSGDVNFRNKAAAVKSIVVWLETLCGK